AAVVGSSPSFSVTATTSSGVTNYQWFLNGNSVSGGTARTLTRANVQPASFGAYTVSVSDGFTSVTSSPPANLTFAVSPNITSPSVSGGNFNLTFNSEFGPAYVVDFKSNLTNATWTPVATNNG